MLFRDHCPSIYKAKVVFAFLIVSVSTFLASPPSQAAVSASQNSDFLPNVTSVQLGAYHSCALMDTKVFCWGANSYGQLGLGLTSDYITTPTQIPNLIGVAKLSVGDSHNCAILFNSTVKCWGYNYNGQLGLGYFSRTGNLGVSSPTSVPNLSGVIDIDLGYEHSCAVTATANVMCWGHNYSGQLGLGFASEVDISNPTAVPNLEDVKSVRLGDWYSCALLNSGRVYCWGYNDHGEAGVGFASSAVTSPTIVPGLSQVRLLSTGGGHACAVDNTLKCWGFNALGQVGVGTQTGGVLQPQPIDGVSSVKSISLGGWHTCITENSGKLKCWGWNGNGELGISILGGIHNSPELVTGVSSADEVSVGDWHSCVKYGQAIYKCWGLNNYGQIGIGYVSASNPNPSIIPSLSLSLRNDLTNLPLTTSGEISKVVSEGEFLSLAAPSDSIFTEVSFASYGTPQNFTMSNCSSTSSIAQVASYFLGKNSGAIQATNQVFGDPCVGTIKRLAVKLKYASSAIPVFDVSDFEVRLTNQSSDILLTNPGLSKLPDGIGIMAASESGKLCRLALGNCSFGNSLDLGLGKILVLIFDTNFKVLQQVELPGLASISLNLQTSEISVGQNLGSSSIQTSGETIPGLWSWLNPSLTPGRGTSSQVAVFTPTDSANYESVQVGIPVKVNLLPLRPAISSVTSDNGSITATIAPARGITARTISGYQYSLDGGQSTFDAELSGRSFTVSDLANGQQVSVQVRAVNADGESPWSSVKTAIPATTPDAPQITFVRAGMNSVLVHFVAPNTSGARIRSFQYSLDGGQSWQAPSVPAQLSPIKITGLTRKTDYQIQVRSINIKGAGEGSNIVNVRTANCSMSQCTKFYLP